MRANDAQARSTLPVEALGIMQIDAVLGWLRKNFPHTFFPYGEQKPLKCNIHHDLFAYNHISKAKFSNEAIRQALHRYTSAPSYLKKLVLGEKRIDLNGRVAGVVSAMEQAWARRRLRCFDNSTKLTVTC